jgi:hypothetical protein
MKLASFPEVTVTIAKDQSEYLPLPAHVAGDGVVTCCWEMSWRERLRALVTGKVWHQVMTFGAPLQPQLLAVSKPDLAEWEGA